jgi:uncharacterized protein YhdP
VVWLGAVAGVSILMIGISLWRLLQGPIELDPLVPYVEGAFARADLGLNIKISGVRLGLDRASHEMHLWAEGVHASLPNGETVASFPEMSTSFSLGSLLRGRLAPTQVSVDHAVVHLKRHEAGAITFRVGDADEGAADFGPQVLDPLIGGDPASDAVLSSLRRLRVRDATVILDDKSTGKRWRITHVDTSIARNARGVDGDISLAFPIGTNTPEFRASFRYGAAEQKADVTITADGVDPVAVASVLPELRPLGQIHSAVAGTLTSRLDLKTGHSEGMRLDLGFSPGQWHSGLLPSGVLDIASGELHAVYAPETSELHLEQFALDLGEGSRLVVDGTVGGLTPEMLAARVPPPVDLAGKLGVVLTHVTAARLDKVWPTTFSAGGRRWMLANVHDGVLDEASAQLDLRLNTADYTVNVLAAQGNLRYHDLTVTYFNGLLPVRKASGTGTFADKRLELIPTAGVLKNLKITGGSIVITDIGAPVEWTTIDVGVTGPIQDALEVIDAKPLHYAHAAGLNPAHVGGRVDGQLHFRLPLLTGLKIDMVDYGLKATLSAASITKALLDRNLTDGNFTLDIGHTGAHLQGNARFDGVPLTLDEALLFQPSGGPKARCRVTMQFDDEARRRLDLDFSPEVVSGPVGADVTYTMDEPGRGEAAVALDLRAATLSIAETGWKKPADVPGTAKIVLDIDKEALDRIPAVEIKAPGLDGRFGLTLTPDHKQVDRVEIKRLVLGGSDISGILARRPAGGWRADLRGPRLDASPLIHQDTGDSGTTNASPFAVAGHFDRLILGPHRELHNATVQLVRHGGIWQSAQLNGRYANGHQLALQISGDGPVRKLVVDSDDLGASLNLLGVTENVVGGRLSITGQLTESGNKRTIKGHVEGSDYAVVRAPAFARILGMASLGGFAGALSGDGIPFSTLRGDFIYNGGRIGLERLVAYGGAIGLTANGIFDIDRDYFDLQGTIAPAYALNSLPGFVPIVGALLTGGEGQGLFAANYHLSGPAANPQVSVNPLSAIAPGFLRQIFSFAVPTIDSAPEPPR